MINNGNELSTTPAGFEFVNRRGTGWSRQKWISLSNRSFRYFCIVSAVLLCIVLFSIIYFVGSIGFLTFKDVPLSEFLFSTNWEPMSEEPTFGAGVFIFGTLSLTALTLLLAVPVAICMAVFLSEVAPAWLKNLLRPIMDLLVGIPSIVYGYIGLTVFIPFLRNLFNVGMGEGLLVSSMVLAIMILPTISSICDDAITAVPKKYREAAYGMGSTRLQTIVRVVIPAAKRGIITAVILGMARAIGETMAVVMVIGNVANIPGDLFTPTSVLTGNIVNQITQVTFDSTWSHALYLMAFLLLAISLGLIIAIRAIRPKGEK